MFNKILIFLILLCSAYFFQLAFLPEQLVYLIQFGVTGMMFVIIVVQMIYGYTYTQKLNFGYTVVLILASVFLSMIIAQAYHGQNYPLSVWANRFMYFYLFYFFLHLLKPEIKDIEKIIIILGAAYAVAYLVQFVIYPITIFDVRQEADRGTIRIFIPGGSFMMLALFFFLRKFYLENKMRYIFYVLLFYGILVMQGTRNSMAATALVIILSLIFSKTIRSKYIIYLLFLLSVIPMYMIFNEIFVSLIEKTEEQTVDFESDIRVRAATYFLTDFFPNKLAYFLGNSQDHMGSVYGMRVHTLKIAYGFYQSDVGFIGEFSKYGLIFALGAFWLLVKVLTTRLRPEHEYIKYYLYRSIILLPFGSGFTNPSSIAVLCLIMYIADCNINGVVPEKDAQEAGNEEDMESSEEPAIDEGTGLERPVSHY
jgi:hypothetical protein